MLNAAISSTMRMLQGGATPTPLSPAIEAAAMKLVSGGSK